MLDREYTLTESSTHEYATMRLGEELLGITVMSVQDVLRKQKVAPVPLSPPIVAGLINLRGRIVTVIDMRKRFGMESVEDSQDAMHVVIEHGKELYSLMVDEVGEVLRIVDEDLEKTPLNLSPAISEVAANVYRLKEDILVILDTHNLMHISH